jgi:hypothetical protein
VSRDHAEIILDGTRHLLRDRGSRFGTFVNGQPVSGDTSLKAGDVIRLGRGGGAEMVYQSGSDGDAASVPAAAAAIGDLVLGKRRQEASCGPAFLVGLLGELGPHQLDGGQAQVGEQQLDARGIDRAGRFHATPPSSTGPVFGA